ncbi:MAG: radical SAM protein [Candidatus Thorarchaeota archaeon]
MLDGTLQRRLRKIGSGSIIKRFEMTPYPRKEADVVCPHFLELKWGYGCPYDCSWCFLKGTLRMLPEKTAPKTKPRDKVKKHVLSAIKYKSHPEMFNTGELCDSLMDERGAVPFSKWIIDIFESQNTHKVLFLTKSSYVKRLLKVEKHRQAVISFSINAEKVSRKWERAPSVRKRIEAASRLSEEGWEVRVRIDPMVPLPDWREAYANLVDLLFTSLTPNRVTLGTLRGLQSTLNNVKDHSWIKYLDGDNSGWGKKTNDDLREKMYQWMFSLLEPHMSLKHVGLCKETLRMIRTLGLDFREQVCNCIL